MVSLRTDETRTAAAPAEDVIESLADGQSFGGQKLRLVAAAPDEAPVAETREKPKPESVEAKISWVARVAEQAAGLSAAPSAEGRELGQRLLADLGAYRQAEIRPLLKTHYRAQVGRAPRRRLGPRQPAMAPAAHPAPARPPLAELFCAQHGVLPERCEEEILRRTLYPAARIAAPLLRFFNPRYFTSDLEFVQGVAQLRSREHLADEIVYFRHHPWNRGFWRRTLRLRISVRRMRALVAATFRGAGSG